jgi:hypothetical protein
MIRMLMVGYVFAIRSERLICREVQVNLAYRWFCKLGIEDTIPDHSAFSRALAPCDPNNFSAIQKEMNGEEIQYSSSEA